MDETPLGKPTDHPDRYDPRLLVSLPRRATRAALGIGRTLPFVGEDFWNGYEFSWLTRRGVPRVAAVRLRVDAASPRLVESKSMKLYLNAFAQTAFDSTEAVQTVLTADFAAGFGAPVEARVVPLESLPAAVDRLPGSSLDQLDVEIAHYQRAPELLSAQADAPVVNETLHTDLFRSLCPVTGQPDWASLLVRYTGPPIDHSSLLRYLVSYRRHQAFHETTVEQIFVDLKACCGCRSLLVAGYFLRRGGIDINPLRADPGLDRPVLRVRRQ